MRVTLKEDGSIDSWSDYYPFGKESRSSVSVNKPREQFTGKERDAESGLDYFGARYYNSEVGRWMSVDPKAGKYPSLSPFVYVANNPLKFIDPDGKKIEFAKGSSEAFIKAYNDAVAHLKDHGAGKYIAELEKSSKVFTISQSKSGEVSHFSKKTGTISWNPQGGLLTNNGHILSPATVLNHEADHALQSTKNPSKFKADVGTKDASYENLEEKRVITGSENETATALGEIKSPEATRDDHFGTVVETTGPTSTELSDAIVITPNGAADNTDKKKEEEKK